MMIPLRSFIVVLAALDDKLVHVVVGISKEVAYFVRKLAGAVVAAASLLVLI